MARKIKQFKYYPPAEGEEDKITPKFINGTIFAEEGGVYPILQLGIQGLPGTKFYLNGSIYPICIGLSGIYDLEVKNGVIISKLEFSADSMAKYKNGSVLIVDIIYEEKEG